MRRVPIPLLPTALLTALVAGPLAAAEPPDEPGGDVSASQDLLAVLHLRGLPCDAVVSHERLGPADYAVRCRDGHRYRIRVDADERVIVEAQTGAGD